ncbi:MAG: hypothetical protein Q8N23_22455 [Archangium sp.]|nr:hypothetical protein [Archangium sp.]MDP3573783.1 hypothetical protein [Archangium sp.]
MSRPSLTVRFLAASAALAFTAGCAIEQDPINRVQPNYYDKTFFVGADFQGVKDDPEFYSQSTLVDVGYGAGQDGLFTSTYAQPLSRVKWQVTEGRLIARLAYERVKDTDGKGVGKATNDGIVVASYPITSHFDIRRQYNPQTGEQLNVIEENTQDRPWFERQFMRVNWSRNESTDNYEFDTLSQMGVYGGVHYTPLAYDVTDPADEDAPHIDAASGYLDITNKAFAVPEMVTIEQWGFTFPACFLDADIGGGGAPTTQCSPVELTIRNSFRKVPDNDYEPADWDGYRFQAFGAFTTDRKGYAREYGMTDTQWHRFINRYNLWDRSHFYTDPVAKTGAVACFTSGTTPVGADAHRDVNDNGTEDECETVGGGSRCDTFSQKCTLPFRDRVVKPVVWYYTEGSNPDFFDASREATHEWDVALRSSIQAARYTECVRTKGSGCNEASPMYFGQQDDNHDAIWLAKEVDDCRAGLYVSAVDCEALADTLGAERNMPPGVIALAKMQEAAVLCHSPVEANDPAACGSPRLPATLTSALCFSARLEGNTEVQNECRKALNVRKGDLRYHAINTIVTPQTPSPWGIMVDGHDPLTGEKVSASINVWSHVTDLWSQGVVDTARYIKGELTTADVTEGTYVRDWASAAEAASTGGSLAHLGPDEQKRQLAASLGADMVNLDAKLEQIKGSTAFKKAKAMRAELSDVRFDAKQGSTTRAIYDARRKHALDTPTEAALTTRTMQQLAGNVSRFDTSSMLAFASPLRGANPAIARELKQARELALAERGACIMHESPAPLGIADLANVLEAKFGPFNPAASKADQAAHAERARRYVAQRAHYAVLTHEIGHSIALRHNFVSSSDAWNYRPQYWQLRTDNGTNTTKCTAVDPTGSCLGPRSLDAINANERANLLSMFMQSSTMDYAGEATQDFLGLGAYDFAATRMFYGDVAAVIDDPQMRAGSDKARGALGKIDNFGGILGISFDVGDGAGGTDPIHYTELQSNFGMIRDCVAVDPAKYRPATWHEESMGTWNPTVDGLIVQVNGAYQKCRQIPVDYINWSLLRAARPNEAANVRSTKVIDPFSRVRFPYGFATDRWADLGNLSVYRHDNGADPYELFDFLITQQEVNHIFDNYRRNRQTFSVRTASGRTLSRYNEKLRDAAKGMGLIANIYKDFAVEVGYDYDTLWPYLGTLLFSENLVASGLGFDHFARQMSRPQSGPHSLEGGILRSTLDTVANPGNTVVTIPNGATGYFGNVTFGGRPMENALSETNGEYDSEFTINVGSYYDKAWAPMLMTESVDNFISDSRRDFLDGRYRAVSMADLFPEGYRRWLGNNLTGDDAMKGSRLAAQNGVPTVEGGFPAAGIGYISWWKPTPEICFQSASSLECGVTPANSIVIDPQIGWEQQKFLIAMTLMYLPENAQQGWLDQMNIWELGADTDPGFANRIELHLPEGKVYIAKTFGKETMFGKTVQRGVAARMLQYANELVEAAYVTDPGPDRDGDTVPDWTTPRIVAGKAVVKFDPTIDSINAQGGVVSGRPGCDATDSTQCTCTSNRACLLLQKYTELPFFMRQAMRDYGLANPSMKGIY